MIKQVLSSLFWATVIIFCVWFMNEPLIRWYASLLGLYGVAMEFLYLNKK